MLSPFVSLPQSTMKTSPRDGSEREETCWEAGLGSLCPVLRLLIDFVPQTARDNRFCLLPLKETKDESTLVPSFLACLLRRYFPQCLEHVDFEIG